MHVARGIETVRTLFCRRRRQTPASFVWRTKESATSQRQRPINGRPPSSAKINLRAFLYRSTAIALVYKIKEEVGDFPATLVCAQLAEERVHSVRTADPLAAAERALPDQKRDGEQME